MKDQDTSQRLSSATGGGVPLTYVIALVPVASVLNVIGGTVAGALKLPIFLDMIGTAVVAMTIGPWWGALVGVITNVTSGFITGPVSIPFAACNVVGALIWGYGTKWGWANDKLKFFGLSVASAVGVSLMAAPIVIFVFGGATGHASDVLTAGLLAAGGDMWTSVFSSNIIVSSADKILSSFLALAIIGALPTNLQVTGPIMKAENMGKAVLITAGTVVGVILTVVSMNL
ncbi:MAG: ECF transporter S component [Actinobacteria bacterium]|nr:ECF transporter S component [Actinomycetota bacterium]MBT7013915.1 ECF transporter S component [Actinomycetota bacterium]MDA8896672.1 ECF transporter S component [Acidimicrobiia bacterium]